MKRIVIAGGNGFLGNAIIRYSDPSQYNFIVLSRKNKENRANVFYVKWDGKSLGQWCQYLEGAYALVNLSGRSVNCRYNEQNKQAIYSSRLDTTHILGKAINLCQSPPKIWVNAASATIYRHAVDRPMDEEHGEVGAGFSVDVCKKWEDTFNRASTPFTRKVLLRTSIVLGARGGALQSLLNLVKMGFGGPQGDGDQYVSWLHEKDFVRIVQFAIENLHVTGTYNATSPYPVTNRELMRTIRQKYRVSFGIPLRKWAIDFGAWLIGTEPEMVLKSRWVLPSRLDKDGFSFQFPRLDRAILDICKDQPSELASSQLTHMVVSYPEAAHG